MPDAHLDEPHDPLDDRLHAYAVHVRSTSFTSSRSVVNPFTSCALAAASSAGGGPAFVIAVVSAVFAATTF